MEDFLYKWQELIGAALGPFLGVILAAIGFWVKGWIERKRERRETLRRIEIAITRSLNDSFVAREQLKRFAKLLRKLGAGARAETNPKVFFLERINFPSIREVYRDADAPVFKVKSYYLHNKLSFIDAGIKEVNDTLVALRNDFAELMRNNEMLVTLMQKNPNPPVQRETYAESLEAFAAAIEGYANAHLNEGIKMMSQIKVYNDWLRKQFGFFTWWKYESTRLKYFPNKSEQRKYARNLDSLDKIDTLIEAQVVLDIAEAEARGEKYAKERASKKAS